MVSYAVIGRAIRELSSNSVCKCQVEAWFGNGGSGGKGRPREERRGYPREPKDGGVGSDGRCVSQG
jgi:hypothetical protein